MRHLRGVVLAISCAVLATGCGGSGEKIVRVKGAVNLDGKPLADGQISFDGQDGKPPEIVTVQNGVYELTTRPGKKVVRITATRMTKVAVRGMPEMKDPVPVNYLPARFNTESKLTADVTDGGANEFKFDVKSK